MIIINKKLYHTVKEASEDLGITMQEIHNAVKVQGTRTLKFYPNNTACRWKRSWNRTALNLWGVGACISWIMFDHIYWLLPFALSIFVTSLVLFIDAVFSSS